MKDFNSNRQRGRLSWVAARGHDETLAQAKTKAREEGLEDGIKQGRNEIIERVRPFFESIMGSLRGHPIRLAADNILKWLKEKESEES